MSATGDAPALRVLVVDDSAYKRQTITNMLEATPGVEVAGRAINGKEALRLVFDIEPDAITLDLEMPEMDGFSFLRLLMSKRPTPVIVISGYAQRDNVFRALELGALDFIAKPGRHISPDIRDIQQDLGQKIAMVRRLQAVRLKERAERLAAQRGKGGGPRVKVSVPEMARPPDVVVGVGASTGGPPAIQQLLVALQPGAPMAIVIAQHMPVRFTQAFAARLDRVVDYRVVEASDGEPVAAGVVYIAPGAANLEIERRGASGPAVFRVVEPPKTQGGGSITPSADHLFKSAARAYGSKFCAVILTGMGSDGSEGARATRERGGAVFVEDPDTAVMPGMPHSAVEAGVVDKVAALEQLPAAIEAFVAARRRNPAG
jgi:two-component system chemotaxis response regulator CheB